MRLSATELEKLIKIELRNFLFETKCPMRSEQSYDSSNYSLQENDVEDLDRDWVKVRRKAFNRLLKLCDPSSSPYSALK